MHIELQLSHRYIKYDNNANMIFFNYLINEMHKNHNKEVNYLNFTPYLFRIKI